MKNRMYANRGKLLEQEIIITNDLYKRKGIANIQKISTPWSVIWNGGAIKGAYPEEKSTLDFRGTVKPGYSISFDCKETKSEKGLPLADVREHQITYIKDALPLGEISFIITYMYSLNKRFLIPGGIVLCQWELWQKNKGKRGYNYIPIEKMHELKSSNSVLVDYISCLQKLGVISENVC